MRYKEPIRTTLKSTRHLLVYISILNQIEIWLAVPETKHAYWRTVTTSSSCIHLCTSSSERITSPRASIKPLTRGNGNRLQHYSLILRKNTVWTLPVLFTMQLILAADTAWHLTGHAWPLTWDKNVKSIEYTSYEKGGEKYTFSQLSFHGNTTLSK